jgi:hypothetical protein
MAEFAILHLLVSATNHRPNINSQSIRMQHRQNSLRCRITRDKKRERNPFWAKRVAMRDICLLYSDTHTA